MEEDRGRQQQVETFHQQAFGCGVKRRRIDVLDKRGEVRFYSTLEDSPRERGEVFRVQTHLASVVGYFFIMWHVQIRQEHGYWI